MASSAPIRAHCAALLATLTELSKPVPRDEWKEASPDETADTKKRQTEQAA